MVDFEQFPCCRLMNTSSRMLLLLMFPQIGWLSIEILPTFFFFFHSISRSCLEIFGTFLFIYLFLNFLPNVVTFQLTVISSFNCSLKALRRRTQQTAAVPSLLSLNTLSCCSMILMLLLRDPFSLTTTHGWHPDSGQQRVTQTWQSPEHHHHTSLNPLRA